jgi:hypothetical protein
METILMDITVRRSAQIVIVALFSVVITQIIYVGLSSVGADINRSVIWTTEAVAFLAISLFALIPLVRGNHHSAAWAAVSLGGVFNVIQVGMGLAMFGPLKDAGEAMAPAFQSILAGAFFAYFAGKFLFGLAAILTGVGLLRSDVATAKGVGGLAMLTGLAAMLTNLVAMAVGMDMIQSAGAAGTAATAFLGLTLILVTRAEQD